MKRGNIAILVGIVGLLMFAAAVNASTEHPGAITGTVIDQASGQPVVGAWVAIRETNTGAMTDSLGRFAINDVIAGTCHLVIFHKTYGTVADLPEQTVVVKSSETTAVRIELTVAENEQAESQVWAAPRSRCEVGKDAVRGMSFDDKLNASRIVDADKIKRQSAVKEPPPPPAPPGACYAPSAPSIRPRCIVPRVEAEESDGWSLPPVDMFYHDYGTNGFTSTRYDRFSTFAVDVDDASYTLARRYLEEGNLPPTEAIRIEEFVNHFDYGYNNPVDSKFRIFTELTKSPFDSRMVLMKVGIKGRELAESQRKPVNMTLVVDISGSMTHGNRIGLVKEALKMLVTELGRHDQVGIVVYNTTARIVLKQSQYTRKHQIYEVIESLCPFGSTNAEAGLTLGYQMADRNYVPGHNNVVVLISDGVANVGETGADGIMDRIQRFANKGITLSTYGVGMGNYNDVLLEQLAQKGNGRYAYVNDRDEARREMIDKFIGNTSVLGRDVKIQVAFNEKLVSGYRLIGYENRDVEDYRFRDNTQDGGEIGAGHEVTALYELQLHKIYPQGRLADVFVRWKDADETEVVEVCKEEVLTPNLRSFDRERAEFRLAVVASRFAEKLKGTAFSDGTGYDELLEMAQKVDRDLHQDQTRELVDLIRRARDLSYYHTDYGYDGSERAGMEKDRGNQYGNKDSNYKR